MLVKGGPGGDIYKAVWFDDLPLFSENILNPQKAPQLALTSYRVSIVSILETIGHV